MGSEVLRNGPRRTPLRQICRVGGEIKNEIRNGRIFGHKAPPVGLRQQDYAFVIAPLDFLWTDPQGRLKQF